MKLGDTITLGGVPLMFLPQTVAEREEQEAKRRAERPAAIWPSFLWLTVFQVLACLQLIVAAGTEATIAIPLAFLGLTVLMWLYYAALRATRCVGFEMETIAFFLSTLSLSITASSAQGSLFKQFLAILLGLALFLVLGLFLRDLSRVQKNRWLMAAAAIGLLGITLVIGNSKYGAVNWISIGGMSFQPSEIAKICYIFAGAATLERLFHKRNLTLFIVLTGVCIGLLGLMSDFGTAAIFFVTFLVIAYMRSGDFATLSLICGGAVFGAGIILKFKPYILSRFASWGHAWEAASTTGYQQTRTMSAAASGGLLGMGAGNGWLHNVAAADTDLVFGMLCEEWGLLIAVLAVGVHRHVGVFRRPGLPGGPVQLLHHRRLRGIVPAGVSDLPERVRLRGPAAPDRRHVPLCLQRRLRHDVRLGAAGLSEGHRHPGERQLCHRPQAPAAPDPGGPPAGRAGQGTPSARKRRNAMKKIERRAFVCLVAGAAAGGGPGILPGEILPGRRQLGVLRLQPPPVQQQRPACQRHGAGPGRGRALRGGGRTAHLLRQCHRPQGHSPCGGGPAGQYRHRGPERLCRQADRVQPAERRLRRPAGERPVSDH